MVCKCFSWHHHCTALECEGDIMGAVNQRGIIPKGLRPTLTQLGYYEFLKYSFGYKLYS